MSKVRVNWGRLETDHTVQVYCVYNSSHKNLYVLARDEGTAMSIAHTANHIHDTKVIHADQYGRAVYGVGENLPTMLASHSGAIEKAVDQRFQGTLHVIDGDLSVGDEVIEP